MSLETNNPRIPAPGGAVVLQSETDYAAHDEWQWAPIDRRVATDHRRTSANGLERVDGGVVNDGGRRG